jgi:peptide/nickel transport system substrate-binding protein
MLKQMLSFSLYILLILVSSTLAACSTPGPAQTPVVTTVVVTEATEPVIATAVPSPTPRPERTLVVCLGEEPDTLYPYAGGQAEAKSVLQAVYDGPFDTISFARQPAILEKIPSLADEDALIQVQPVSPGDLVVDQNGIVTPLVAGVRVRPSGCFGGDCAVDYDGSADLTMDQLQVSFRLLPGLTWSDGAALTVADSRYGFELASAPETAGSKFKTDRTASYEVVDELTVRWTGLPGFMDPTYSANFWTPAPQHLWGQFSPAELPGLEIAARNPVGYGPYTIESWNPGDHIRLRINQNYFRAAEGLPRFENLVFRFIGLDSDANIAQLLSGECDILDRTTRLNDRVELLQALADEGQIKYEVVPGLDWEHAVFGIVPATYDDGLNLIVDRPDLFGDPRTRQAITLCMDRQAVIDRVLYGQSAVLDTYVPQWHPLANPAASGYAYDPEAGSALLDEVGWVDHDVDPATPRQAQGVLNVPNGTLLSFTYLTTLAEQRRQSAEILAESLAACGIQAEVVATDPGELYSSGPEGPLFGRQFEMGQFAWRINEVPPCFLFLSESIPGDPALVDETGERVFKFGWGGWNLTGYNSLAFDTACQNARAALPGQSAFQANHFTAQEIFAIDLPAVPLYMHLDMAAVRPDLCNFVMDSTVSSDLWNIEALDYGPGCEE